MRSFRIPNILILKLKLASISSVFDPSAHRMWDTGFFALKLLILANDKKLTVQFFWQPQYDHKLGDRVDLLKEPLSSRDLRFTEKE